MIGKQFRDNELCCAVPPVRNFRLSVRRLLGLTHFHAQIGQDIWVTETAFPGLRDGYFRADEEAQVVEQIISSKADCLFIAMPTPRKERFLSAYRDRLDVPFIMGVGGAVDVIDGYVRRAQPIIP